MLIGNKIKLYPTNKQQEQIDKTIGCCRFLYNQMLSDRIENYKNGIKNKIKTEKQYKEVYQFLKDASSRGLQQARIDLESAYKKFFRRVKNGEKKVGFPKFKSKHKCKWSYREPQQSNGCIKVQGNKLILLKLGGVKFKGEIKGIIRNVTISKGRDGNYTASVLTEFNQRKIERRGTIGVDMGLHHIATTSDGKLYLPYISEITSKIKKQQRRISKKVKGSKSKQKALVKLNRLYKKKRNKKNHYHCHVINDILGENQTLCTEKLSVKEMMKNKLMSKQFQEMGLGDFLIKLRNKALMNGIKVIEADRFYPSSKLCSCCGNKNTELKISDRIYKCKCGLKLQRDFNASLNLKALSGEYSDYRNGDNVRLVEKFFNFNTSSFLGSSYNFC